jgi:porin
VCALPWVLRIRHTAVTLTLSHLLICAVVAEENLESRPRLGGPQSVENTIDSDRAERKLEEAEFLQGWYSWTDRQREDNGLSLGLDYSITALTADATLNGVDDEAAGAIGRVYGRWQVTGRGSDDVGSIVFRLAHHHAYTDTAPQDFALENLGYVGLAYTQWDDADTKLGNLLWRQSWNNGDWVLVGGYQDVADFFDVYALADPFKHFLNLGFLTAAGTASLPASGALGIAAGGWISEHVYLQGGFADANADATDTGDSFDTFFNDREYFYHLEIGMTTSKSRAYLDNLHLSLWQADEREDAGVADGWGAALSASYFLNNGLLPFLKAGYAHDGGSLLRKSVSVGMGYMPRSVGSDAGNLLMVAANWSKPNDAVVGRGLNDQYALEASYRWQLSRELALTPNFQFLKDPALNPDKDQAWVIGIRMRVAI